jgi:predicted PurR-regulated permease PerM
MIHSTSAAPEDSKLEISAEKPITGFDLRLLPLVILPFGIGFACLAILRPFLALITWAAILAYVSWPLYRRVDHSAVLQTQPRFL